LGRCLAGETGLTAYFGIVGTPDQVVDGNVVGIGDAPHHVDGRFHFAVLIPLIGTFPYPDGFGYLFLRQTLFFPKAFQRFRKFHKNFPFALDTSNMTLYNLDNVKYDVLKEGSDTMNKNSLKAYRERIGKTQVEVVMETGIPMRSYQRYEYDTSQPTVQSALRIAKSLGTTVEKIWGAQKKD